MGHPVSVCNFRLGQAFPSISGYRGGGGVYFRRHKVSGYEPIVSPASNAGLGMHWVIPSLLYTRSQRGA